MKRAVRLLMLTVAGAIAALVATSGAFAAASTQAAVTAHGRAPFPFTLVDLPLLVTGGLAMLVVVAGLRRFSHET